jgi:hypothetical protein
VIPDCFTADCITDATVVIPLSKTACPTTATDLTTCPTACGEAGGCKTNWITASPAAATTAEVTAAAGY